MNLRMTLAAAVFATLFGCATAQLTSKASSIVLLSAPPGPQCTNLGSVIGQGGGAPLGAFAANDKLTEWAINDAVNKAAEKDATHVVLSPPQLGGASGTTCTATVTGVAYGCDRPGAARTTPVPVPGK